MTVIRELNLNEQENTLVETFFEEDRTTRTPEENLAVELLRFSANVRTEYKYYVAKEVPVVTVMEEQPNGTWRMQVRTHEHGRNLCHMPFARYEDLQEYEKDYRVYASIVRQGKFLYQGKKLLAVEVIGYALSVVGLPHERFEDGRKVPFISQEDHGIYERGETLAELEEKIYST